MMLALVPWYATTPAIVLAALAVISLLGAAVRWGGVDALEALASLLGELAASLGDVFDD